jgi:hypothetical protein
VVNQQLYPSESRTVTCAPPLNPCESHAGEAPNGLSCTGTRCAWFQTTQPTSGNRIVCESGCLVQGGDLVNGMAWFNDEVKMWGVVTSGNKYTGQQCTSADTPTPGTTTSNGTGGTTTVPEITPDNTGKCPGTVNGVEVWVPCDKTMTPSSSTSSSTSGTDVTTTNTESVTSCKDGICSTTTTTTVTVTAGGSGTATVSSSTGSGTGTIAGFCKENPAAQICGKDGAFGGACSTGTGTATGGTFTCTEDPVMCAIAKATNQMKCLLSTDSTEAQAYAAAKAASGSSGLGTTTTAISSASFSQEDLLPGGAGMQDRSITLAGTGWSKTVNLEFSRVNTPLGYLGSILVAVSFLLAMIIVFRR